MERYPIQKVGGAHHTEWWIPAEDLEELNHNIVGLIEVIGKYHTMQISILVAVSENNVIGYKNKIPWHLPGDLKRFKDLTMGHWILMGRKTFESIGKALPGRTNAVITGNSEYIASGCKIFASIKEAVACARENGESEVFIIGGEKIYQEALPLCKRIYLTRVQAQIEGDVFFPSVEWKEWKILQEEYHPSDSKHLYPLTFYILEKSILT
jgi:dihydrofolate reductase